MGNPEGQARLRAHGFDSVPAVASGDRIVSGGDLKAIADLVGFDYEPPMILPPDVLMAKWDSIMESACRFIRQIPTESMGIKSPDRDRSLLGLSFHIVSIGRTFLRVYDDIEGGLRMPEGMATGEEVATFGEETRVLLRTWWHDVGVFDPLDRVVESYQGIQSLLEYLERETWHTAQHTRQVMMFLEQLGITADRPLTADQLAGLPLPERVWD